MDAEEKLFVLWKSQLTIMDLQTQFIGKKRKL